MLQELGRDDEAVEQSGMQVLHVIASDWEDGECTDPCSLNKLNIEKVDANCAQFFFFRSLDELDECFCLPHQDGLDPDDILFRKAYDT